ncbi:hypothetical protein Asp14428_44480 [Actinoplanes sp. NBRC 14428]|uniref:Uncharacterized protein n=1 Tax=Pseudosporangium ferrugineum TaxID=439699 RepID=A0A2T0S7A6_9ACTN|nr:hypothetical protein [Pseudosporangium ferrugineum]PRY29307.1 hypothetical protein CLV70_10624 [Pseudosporangium ferrugineum]BCJ52973.1 hypothetical protein Asp14428_44480 [Actinoplanes sp. NBRC 14428]
MHSIGITGHIHLTRSTMRSVREALVADLRGRRGPLHGVTCLAPGPDRIFAEVLTALGGTYDVVLPAADQLGGGGGRRASCHVLESFLAGAREVIVGPFPRSGAAAYAFANEQVVARCQELIAVWDGHADEQPGSTAHAVWLARRAAVPVNRIWPERARRSRAFGAEPGRRPSTPLIVGSATT